MRAKFELADVIWLFGIGLVAKSKLAPMQLKVLGKIASCRTATLGGHEEASKAVERYATVTTVAATAIVQNARRQNKPSGLKT